MKSRSVVLSRKIVNRQTDTNTNKQTKKQTDKRRRALHSLLGGSKEMVDRELRLILTLC